jgi:ABC-type glycerol-3-phosphate transport system permease component
MVIIVTAFLIICSIILAYPFFWMISATFKPSIEVFSIPPTLIPKNPILDNYVSAFTKTQVSQWFINSTIVVAIRIILSLFFCSLAAFAFAKYQFKFKNILFILMISTLMIPFSLF